MTAKQWCPFCQAMIYGIPRSAHLIEEHGWAPRGNIARVQQHEERAAPIRAITRAFLEADGPPDFAYPTAFPRAKGDGLITFNPARGATPLRVDD